MLTFNGYCKDHNEPRFTFGLCLTAKLMNWSQAFKTHFHILLENLKELNPDVEEEFLRNSIEKQLDHEAKFIKVV